MCDLSNDQTVYSVYHSQMDILDTTAESFIAFLEYLYTDHASLEDGDAVGIMVLADQYCQSRLINLCELCIEKEVDQTSTEDIQKSDIDVISLLLTSQVCKGKRQN